LHLRSWRTPALAVAAVAALTTLGLVAMPASGSTATGRPTPAQLKLMLKDIRQTVINKKLVATPSHAPNGIKLYESGNWAGYLALPAGSTKTFKSISASFTVPSANCTAGGVGDGDAFAYHWIGLDGWSDGTVEQDGVGVLCEGGTAYYISWWETYPGGIQVSYNVDPGDQINASVVYNGSDYALRVEDVTTDKTVENVTEPCQKGSTCNRSSAEAITEGYPSSPWLGTADYGASLYSDIVVTNSAGTKGSFTSSAWTDGETEAVQNSELTTQPGGLYTAGTGTSLRSAFENFWKSVDG
jgi:Peptidase A4 family